MNPTLIMTIGIAGALGSISRYLVDFGMARLGSRLPWGTFTVNVLGSFAIGFAMALFALRGEMDTRLRFGITSGFLGGFTTYSAFAFETVSLLENKRAGAALAYVSVTLVAAALAAFAGILLGRAVGGR